MEGGPVVTFDLFSALLDSRAGGSAALDRIGAAHDWQRTGTEVYDAWDSRNKEAQRLCTDWVPYREIAAGALAATYAALDLGGDPTRDVEELLGSVPDWPLWPDVEEGLTELAHSYRIGLLSNVDDDLFATTRAAPYIDPALALTSQRLGAYKPDPRIYLRAREALGAVVHVATSARDVRGALEAAIPVVRLRRPGHVLDPEGPTPPLEATSVHELVGLVEVAWSRAG